MTSYTPAEAKAAALAQFKDPGPDHINCCQAVVRFAQLVLACDERLVTAGRYFGGGVAGMGEACGAITGTALVLGMRDMCLADSLGEKIDELRPRTADSLKQMLGDFTERFGCRRCSDLTGFDMSTAEGHDAFMASDKRALCSDYVGYMCDRVAPLLVDPESAGTGAA